MSEQQTERLKLRRVDNGDIEQTCKEILGGKHYKDVYSLADSYREALLESQFDNDDYRYEVTPQGVYEVIDYELYGGSDIFEASENGDGTIDVLVSFYNGGCSTPEAIEIALEKMKKNGDN